jgi:hypothetical protein
MPRKSFLILVSAGSLRDGKMFSEMQGYAPPAACVLSQAGKVASVKITE